MSRNEKLGVYGVGIVLLAEVIRHFTWGRPGKGGTVPAFQVNGMVPYAGVTRRV